MQSPDYLTLLLYVIGIFVISTVAARRTRNQKEMFSAGRSSPWWASGLSGFMTMFSAGTFVVWGGIAYELGIVAVAINTCYGIAALLAGYLVAGRWNKLGVSTPAEFVQLRFGTTGLHFFTWAMLLKRILGVSVSLYALAKLLVILVPLNEGIFLRDPTTGNLSLMWAVIIFGTIVVLYTMQGGLWAVLMTDVLQFIVLTTVVLMVAILMIGGGSSTVELPEGFFSPTSDNYGWFFLFGWVTINFFMIGAEWAFVQRFLSVKSPQAAKKSSYLFAVMYLVTPIFWLLPPLLYRGQVEGVDKEQAYILAAQSVLPPGALGLMFAAMFSATASMVSSQLNVFAGVLTNDFYRPFINRNASEKNLLLTGRVLTAVLGALLVFFALMVPRMGGAEKLIISINSLLVVPLFAPTLWGLFSRRIGIREMLIVALTSFSIGLALKFGVAQNSTIQQGDSLFQFATLLKESSKNVEVLIGVILPIVMLISFEWIRKGKTDPRSGAIDHTAEVVESETDAVFDPFAPRMVMISLTIIGIWISGLGIWQSEGRAILCIFGVGLLAIAGVIQLFIKRLTAKS